MSYLNQMFSILSSEDLLHAGMGKRLKVNMLDLCQIGQKCRLIRVFNGRKLQKVIFLIALIILKNMLPFCLFLSFCLFHFKKRKGNKN